MAVVAKIASYGDKDDPRNPFLWKDAELNLPGQQPDYDPTYPWVYKDDVMGILPVTSLCM